MQSTIPTISTKQTFSSHFKSSEAKIVQQLTNDYSKVREALGKSN
jgi:uncharacterized membrane-anchored protein YhcB (DUF1043 family)